eukprot:CAMPEP_0184306612 /NCGR_PEP_ID=MMETSP1049-20130417/15567_1 /TAXON_ID=77928 /ORGANISM="Proteomonas sulcata, Strain CCMP704" /LENGTH=203 /DNA_ID=CAMNT_0026618913 /DNA_START=6 /DNA_END=617 /DNA_ORIENTATION=+
MPNQDMDLDSREKFLDPWDTRGRTRASMKTFQGAPWKPAKAIGHEKFQVKPPEYLSRFKSLHGKSAEAVLQKTPGLTGTDFEQCEVNPGVALDKPIGKYRLLLFENGMVKPKGCFFTEADGISAYSAYIDMKSMGPHGVQGVPLSAKNIGPPGVALLPKLTWQSNVGQRKRPSTTLLRSKGYWDGLPTNFNKSCSRPDLVAKS